jgi:hypothetical protein
MPEVRSELVERVRNEIASGTYDTPEKFDLALDAMIDEPSDGAARGQHITTDTRAGGVGPPPVFSRAGIENRGGWPPGGQSHRSLAISAAPMTPALSSRALATTSTVLAHLREGVDVHRGCDALDEGLADRLGQPAAQDDLLDAEQGGDAGEHGAEPPGGVVHDLVTSSSSWA